MSAPTSTPTPLQPAQTAEPEQRTDATQSVETSQPARPMTISSSSATLCQLEEQDKDKPATPTTEHPPPIPEDPSPQHHATAHTAGPSAPAAARHPSTKRPRAPSHSHPSEPAPPIPAPDVVSIFDPASAGGGGPLKRIETQRSERYADEAREARERAEREERGEVEEKGKGMGVLRRWSTVSRRRPVVVLPAHPHRHDEDEISPVEGGQRRSGPGSSPTMSHKTLAITPGEEREKDEGYGYPRDEEEAKDAAESADGEEEEHVYPDGGYGWVVLGACATLAGCTMGWGMNYGVYQEYYLTNIYTTADTSVLSLAGTLGAFMMNFTGFMSGRYGDRYGFKRVLYCSAFVAWLGLFLAGWSTKLWQTILTQGLIAGIGQGMAMPLFMSLPSQWFYRKRGLASGIAIGGAGLGGGTSTLISRQLLTSVGYKKTLIIMSFINLTCMLISIFLIRTRPTSPEGKATGSGPWIDWSVVKTSSFWSLVIGLVVSCTGYAMPYNFTAQWTKLHFPDQPTILLALPVTLLGFTVCIGRAIIGLIADLLGPMNTFILCFILSGVVQLALWLTASTFASILVFAVAFGLVAPGYMGIIPQIIVQLFGPSNLATNVGILLLFNGPGNLISGPIGGALFDASGRTSFKYVIITSGCMQMAGGLIVCWARMKASGKVFKKI
ncbi:hypothetical protein IAT38_004721 [Cryptococcus sp. DSM 104549]